MKNRNIDSTSVRHVFPFFFLLHPWTLQLWVSLTLIRVRGSYCILLQSDTYNQKVSAHYHGSLNGSCWVYLFLLRCCKRECEGIVILNLFLGGSGSFFFSRCFFLIHNGNEDVTDSEWRGISVSQFMMIASIGMVTKVSFNSVDFVNIWNMLVFLATVSG